MVKYTQESHQNSHWWKRNMKKEEKKLKVVLLLLINSCNDPSPQPHLPFSPSSFFFSLSFFFFFFSFWCNLIHIQSCDSLFLVVKFLDVHVVGVVHDGDTHFVVLLCARQHLRLYLLTTDNNHNILYVNTSVSISWRLTTITTYCLSTPPSLSLDDWQQSQHTVCQHLRLYLLTTDNNHNILSVNTSVSISWRLTTITTYCMSTPPSLSLDDWQQSQHTVCQHLRLYLLTTDNNHNILYVNTSVSISWRLTTITTYCMSTPPSLSLDDWQQSQHTVCQHLRLYLLTTDNNHNILYVNTSVSISWRLTTITTYCLSTPPSLSLDDWQQSQHTVCQHLHLYLLTTDNNHNILYVNTSVSISWRLTTITTYCLSTPPTLSPDNNLTTITIYCMSTLPSLSLDDWQQSQHTVCQHLRLYLLTTDNNHNILSVNTSDCYDWCEASPEWPVASETAGGSHPSAILSL